MATRTFIDASQMIISDPVNVLQCGLLFAFTKDNAVIATLDHTDDAEIPEDGYFVTKLVASVDGGFASFVTVPHEGNLQRLAPVAKKTNSVFADSPLEFDKDGHVTAFYTAPPSLYDSRRVQDAILVQADKALILDGMTLINGQPMQVIDWQYTKYLGSPRIHAWTAKKEVFELTGIVGALEDENPNILKYTRIATDVNALVTMPGIGQSDRIIFGTSQGIRDNSKIVPETKGKNIDWMSYNHKSQVLTWGVGIQVYTGVVSDTRIIKVQMRIADLATELRNAGASTGLYENLPPSQIFTGPAVDGKLLVIDWKRQGNKIIHKPIQISLQVA